MVRRQCRDTKRWGVAQSIEFVIIRHGQTPGNEQRRYVGALDQPLSEKGRAQAEAARVSAPVKRVYVSTLKRTHETAALMFPAAEQVVVKGIQEMDFGVFAGRSADEMENDGEYRAWVEGNCEGRCPGGESRDEFSDRICESLAGLLRDASARGEREVVLVAHGGTMMASFDRFADGSRTYYEWLVGNCKGYRVDVILHDDTLEFTNIRLFGEE